MGECGNFKNTEGKREIQLGGQAGQFNSIVVESNIPEGTMLFAVFVHKNLSR